MVTPVAPTYNSKTGGYTGGITRSGETYNISPNGNYQATGQVNTGTATTQTNTTTTKGGNGTVATGTGSGTLTYYNSSGEVTRTTGGTSTASPALTELQNAPIKTTPLKNTNTFNTMGVPTPTPQKLTYREKLSAALTPTPENRTMLREDQLRKAGFNPAEINYLTTTQTGGAMTYYNGKIVPKDTRTIQFYNTANQESQAKEKKFNETAVAVGLGTIGIIPIAVAAGPLAISGGLILAGSQGTTIGQTIGNPFTNEKPTSSLLTQQAAANAGFRQSETRANQDITGRIGYDIVPGGQALFKNSFIEGTKKYLVDKKNYSETRASKEAEAIYQQYAVGGAIGEVAGMVTLSGGTEILGRTFVKNALRNTTIKPGIKFLSNEGKQITINSGIAIAKAGAVEGAGFYNLERTAKMQEFNILNAAMYTAGGAISAGIIGGPLVTGSFTNPKIAKWVQRAAYATDPTEKPGDVSANVISSVLGKNFNPKVKVITIVPTNTNTNTLTNKTKPKTNTLIDIPTKNNSDPIISVNPNTIIPINPNTFTPVNTDTIIPVNPETIIPVNPETIIPVNPNTNTNTDTNTDTNTNTNTNTNTDTNTNTNVNTTTFTGAPFIPIVPFGGGGGRGSNRYKVKNKVKLKNLFFTAQPANKNKIKPISFFRQQTKKPSSFLTLHPKNKVEKNNLFNMLKPTKQKFFAVNKTNNNTKKQGFMNFGKTTKKTSLFNINKTKTKTPIYKPSLLVNKPKKSFVTTKKQNYFFNSNHKTRLI